RRVHVLLVYSNVNRGIFALSKLPVDLTYGKPAAFGDQSNVVCLKNKSAPVLVWIVGEFVRGFFYNSKSGPATRVAASIRPLVTTHIAAAKAVLKAFSIPKNSGVVADAFGPDQVKATKWMTCSQSAPVSEFVEVYDARQALKPKSAMEKIHVDALKERDVVMMEVRICKYQEKGDSASMVKGKKASSGPWHSFYDLEAIYVLE
ncbi:hypothetical protein C8J57DRAFT_997050, partial [Mycena rebaudengoi]